MGYEPKGTLNIEVSVAVAIVLDRMLDEWDGHDTATLQIRGAAEYHALRILAWTFEKELAERGYLSDYAEKVSQAKASIVNALGPPRKIEESK